MLPLVLHIDDTKILSEFGMALLWLSVTICFPSPVYPGRWGCEAVLPVLPLSWETAQKDQGS